MNNQLQEDVTKLRIRSPKIDENGEVTPMLTPRRSRVYCFCSRLFSCWIRPTVGSRGQYV